MKPNTIKTHARIAGLLYLFQIPLGVFGIIYVKESLFAQGDMVATCNNILANEFLFRLSIVSSILCALVTIATAAYLYKILQFVNENQAKWIVIFTLVVAPISMLNELNNLAVLLLLKTSDFSAQFSTKQVELIISALFNLREYGLHIIGIFFGLWLLPMGYLVIKSGYIPKVIGVFLIFACLGYLIDFFTFFLFPDFKISCSEYTWLGEVMMVLWLCIKGIDVEKFKKLSESRIKI